MTERELLYGDAGYAGTTDPYDFDRSLLYGDEGYTGDTFDPDSPSRFFDADYYRTKIREFQATLNAVDAASQALNQIYQIDGLPEDVWYDALVLLQDYQDHRTQFVIATEAINAAAAAANALGVRMPVVQMPQTLGAVPLVAVGAAVAGAAALVAWGVSWINSAYEVAGRVQLLQTLSEPDRAKVVHSMLAIDQARAAAESPLASIAGIVKWVALAGVAFIAWRLIEARR